MKLTLKTAKYTLLAIFLLFVLLVVTFTLAVKTETGSRYLLNIIPDLSVKNPQGTLSGGWSAEELIWQNEEIKITVQNPSLNWFASCLFKGNVCIDRLAIEQLDIDLLTSPQTKETTANSTTQLPTIDLPVDIHIKSIELNKLLINKQEVVTQASLNNARWRKTHITLDSLTLHNTQANANITLNGNIEFADHWPLTVTAKADLDELYHTPWQIQVETKGELQKELQINATSTGYLEANLKSTANVLEENLPASLSLTLHNFIPKNIIELPDTLLIKQLNLTAKGDLVKGFNINNDMTFAGQTTPVQLDIQGLLTAQKFDLQSLALKTSEQHFIKMTGLAILQPTLQADAKIDYQQFPWQELYPLASSPPIDLQTANATLSYQDDRYQAQLNAAITGPAGSFNIHTKVIGDLKQLTLETLQLDTPDKGNIHGTATIKFEPDISWLANFNLKSINPNYWVADLTGSLNGSIQTTGSLANNTIETDSKINIQGSLNKQITQFKAAVIAKQEKWYIPELIIKVGNNSIIGQGQLDKLLKANLAINIPNLKQVLPVLTGSIVGKVQLAGTLQKPQAAVQLTSQRLSFQKQRIQSVKLTANLNAQQQANLSLRANHISSDTIQLGNLNLSGSGDIKKQQLNLQLSGGVVKLLTSISSTQDTQQNWLITINKLQIASQGQDWQLQNTTQLDYTKTGDLTITSHCFKNGEASLCALKQQKLLPTQQIHYQLTNFAMQSLKPWYPENFDWQGVLTANIVLNLPQTGATGTIEIDTNGGVFQLRESTEENWYNFPYQTLSLLVNITPRKIISTLEFKGNALGNLQTQITLDPLAKHKPIQGSFKIDGFDISVFRPFIPNISELSGKIDGYGDIKGLLERPYVSGKVMLKNGTVMGDISVSIENLQATAMIEGESLKLDGSWVSGKKGKATVIGDVDWSNGLNLNIAIQASQLPIIVAPYANLEADTNLKLQIKNNELDITGLVNVPKGSIIVRELPPSTITVSPDAIIITQQTTKEAPPLRINMGVKVIIGQELLTFRGFGLTSNITGNLSITKDLFTQGEINLKNGIYRAYGQRLDITRANILFTGSMEEPNLDIEASRTVDNVVAGVRVTGPTSQPRVTLFSIPTMSQDQALSYIIFGRPLGAGDNNVLAQAALAMGVAGSSETVGAIANKVGIHDFQLDTSGSGNDTSVVASGKISNDLSIHYGVGIFKAVNTIMLRYKLTKSIYLEAAGGTASSLDIFYKKSFN